MMVFPTDQCSLIQKVLSDFAGANYFWIAIVLLAYMLSNVSRAIRWLMLIRPLGYSPRFVNAFLSTIIGYFANLGFPRIGEVVRGGTLARYEKIPVEKVMGTIVVDRTFDVLSILFVTGLAFLLEFNTIWAFVDEKVALSEKFGSAGNLLLILLGIGVFFALLFFLFRKPLVRTNFYHKVVKLALGFMEGLKSVSKLKHPWLFVFHSINIWLMYYLMTYLCFFAFAPTSNLSPVVGLIVFVFGSWGIVIPSPGGMGTYHYLAQTALIMYGVSPSDGFSWANIAYFSIQLGCNILVGILALILLPLINRTYLPKSNEQIVALAK